MRSGDTVPLRGGFCLAAALVLLIAESILAQHPTLAQCPSAYCPPFRVSIFASDGIPLREFVVSDADYFVQRVEMGPDGNVWITRSDIRDDAPPENSMVAVFSWEGIELFKVNDGGTTWPMGVSWDSDGYIYVTSADSTPGETGFVYKYEADGTFMTKFRTEGWGEDWIFYGDLKTTEDDRIIVTARHSGGEDPTTITEFNVDGETVNTFGQQVRNDYCALSSDSTLWVMERFGSLWEFDLEGTAIDTVDPSVFGVGLEVGSDGTLFWLSYEDTTLYEFDENGEVIGETPLRELHKITDFTFGPGGTILVANTTEEVFSVEETIPPAAELHLVIAPNPFGSWTELRISGMWGTDPATVSIFDVTGRHVRDLHVPTRSRSVTWDGVGDSGQLMPAGTFFARLKAGDRYDTTRILLIR